MKVIQYGNQSNISIPIPNLLKKQSGMKYFYPANFRTVKSASLRRQNRERASHPLARVAVIKGSSKRLREACTKPLKRCNESS